MPRPGHTNVSEAKFCFVLVRIALEVIRPFVDEFTYHHRHQVRVGASTIDSYPHITIVEIRPYIGILIPLGSDLRYIAC